MSATLPGGSGPRVAARHAAVLALASLAVACGWTRSPPPTGLTYAVNPAVYAVGVPITANAPATSGGPVQSYDVDPALPAGLVLDPKTGVLSGTPAAVAPEATYTVRASNDGGSASAALVLTVNPTVQPPAALGYATNPAIYTTGQPIPPNVPSSTGGAVEAYTVSPDLPPGLALDPATGVVSGTPTAVSATAAYTVTARNAAGSTSATLTLTVVAAVVPPASVSYDLNPAIYAVGAAIVPNTAHVSGGAATSFTVSPPLPAGLSLNDTSGAISGTPTAAAPQATYTVTAANSAGSASVGVVLTVMVKPGGLGYTLNPATYATGAAIAANTPSLAAGTGPFTYAVSPALPAGLTLNATTGAITGTPTAATAQGTYTVTASNGVGSTTVALTVTVLVPPSNLSYPANPATYTTGVAVTDTPALAGTGPFRWTVSPALPAGLAFNTSTGVISGTPTTAAATANYAVAASNAVGVATVVLVLTVNAAIVAPSGLHYPSNPAIYTVGTAIPANTPTLAGGTSPFTFAVSPALPAGLTFSASTGAVSGTPTTPAAQATYTVTAGNSAGSTTVGLVLTVNAVAPSGLTYTPSTVTSTAGVAITPITPTVASGTAPFTFAVSPALPAGLSFNTSTGAVSGTPTTATAQATYTVTAGNSAGSTSAGLTITVNPAIVAPSGFSYATPSPAYTVGVQITANKATVAGGTPPFTFGVTPALPTGLTLDTATGDLSGTPSVATPATTYVVTATNAAGSTTAALTITVN